ncbi:hypothetical protein COCNU_02G005730 [Cocos nucifera]|uniref:Uncharacterized protein n=1 Tax=Cocos nucifera TaxID=13894 RepID=A0A8K0MWB4_COCNU|nr:hypothetical protein COCNU_02G005730 [Cocos nucifera]
MKFDVSETAKLSLELVIKEAPTKGHEVLPQISQEDGMKFDRAYDLPSASKAQTPRARHQGSPDRRT